MNRVTRAVVLGTVALATLASTLEFASARDRYWRNHHNGRYFHNRAVAAGVLGLTAGVVVGSMLTQPRVVYRERPIYRSDVVVDEGPVYADPDAVYSEPGAEYIGPVDEYAQPDDQEDARPPRDHRRMGRSDTDNQDQGYDQSQQDDQRQMDEQAQDDGYFPNRPEKQTQRKDRNDDVAQGALEPWTAQWRSYCKQRFSSFNATTGTYKGYDGKSHFCTSG
ncbi:MAG: rane protein [Rhizobium sp.]|nr:rane protein [Rhizobium sp.]